MGFKVNQILETVQDQQLLRLPSEISHELPTRGMVMIRGTLNGHDFVAPLEPDGSGSHFLLMTPELQRLFGSKDQVVLDFDVTQDWPEPELPEDILQALAEHELIAMWHSLTVRARWEWLRWIRSTKVLATRNKRIGVAISKLSKGDRRPCCFNTASCTFPELAKSGVLLDD